VITIKEVLKDVFEPSNTIKHRDLMNTNDAIWWNGGISWEYFMSTVDAC
jgi:hypothetical protein